MNEDLSARRDMTMTEAELLALLKSEFREPEFCCGVDYRGFAWVFRPAGGKVQKYALENPDVPFTEAGMIEHFWSKLGGRPDGS